MVNINDNIRALEFEQRKTSGILTVSRNLPIDVTFCLLDASKPIDRSLTIVTTKGLTMTNTNDTVTCKRCGKDTDALAMFPGGICFDCYAAKEGKQPLTERDFNGMVNTFRGKRTRQG